MRIITGTARGCKLLTLDGEATRPTAERVKEAVFSSLQFELSGSRFLDLFSGSGQMALEALSRGAASAVAVDSSAAAVDIIKQNAQKSRLYDRCVVLCRSYSEYLKSAGGRESFDFIYLDPPFEPRILPSVLSAIISAGVAADGAKIICESEHEDILGTDTELKNALRIKKQVRYGRIFVTYLELASERDRDYEE